MQQFLFWAGFRKRRRHVGFISRIFFGLGRRVRALSNLARNALRHAGPASPISVKARREDQTVLLTVAESGPGVPDVELTRIFERFHRLDATRDRITGDIGLG